MFGESKLVQDEKLRNCRRVSQLFWRARRHLYSTDLGVGRYCFDKYFQVHSSCLGKVGLQLVNDRFDLLQI